MPFNPPNEPRGCIWQKAKGPRPDITVCVNSTREVEDTDRRVVHRTILLEKKGGTYKKYLHSIIIEGGLMMGTKKVGVLSSPHKRTAIFISEG